MIRNSTPADADRLVSILNRAFAVDSSEPGGLTRHDVRGMTFLVKVDDGAGRVVGCVRVRRRLKGGAEFRDLAVDADARRQGHGDELLEAAESRARDWGSVTMELRVTEENEPAIALYRSRGYQRDPAPGSRGLFRFWKGL
jgi:ribosomal protein S18 acetylase RimI-like enzyme